jgi:putative redox protein
MKANLKLDRNMRIIGTNEKGLETIFDTSPKVGGEDTAPTPMEIMLQSVAACSFMDTISILRKKRKTIIDLQIDIEGERTEEHPKVFKTIVLKYTLTSPDAELNDLERAVELSQDKYCGASAMMKLAGAEVSYQVDLKRP